jgi:putative restriction endonuclease
MRMFDRVHDARVRAAAFEWLNDRVLRDGDVLPRALLEQGFILDDIRVPLVGPQGIFKPRVLEEVPLSITTAPDGPYDDAFGKDGLLRYRYRGIDPNHRDNRGLRAVMMNRLPLVYFHGIARGRYAAAWPVFVVGDDPAPPKPAFSIAVDDKGYLGINPDLNADQRIVGEDTNLSRRSYITSTVRVRLHQRAFRERVLEAYRRQCAFCRLRHEELLDAAHIIPDIEPEGEPVVRNGVALCNLHHAAFDNYFIGLRPDYIIEIRPDILKEGDGPTLRYAIQSLHGVRIQLPRRIELHPDSSLLSQRYARFQMAIGSSGH